MVGGMIGWLIGWFRLRADWSSFEGSGAGWFRLGAALLNALVWMKDHQLIGGLHYVEPADQYNQNMGP